MKYASHMLMESLQCGFRPCHSVFIGGGHFSRPGSRVTISYSNAGGVIVGGRLGLRSHANTPYSWRIPPSCQGLIPLFCFIHEGRSFHLFQGVLREGGGC